MTPKIARELPSPLRGGVGGGGANRSRRADTPTPTPPRKGEGLAWAGPLALFATPALAHEGHHETLTTAEQVRHLLTEPDHILAMAGLVVLAVTAGWFWRRAKARK